MITISKTSCLLEIVILIQKLHKDQAFPIQCTLFRTKEVPSLRISNWHSSSLRLLHSLEDVAMINGTDR